MKFYLFFLALASIISCTSGTTSDNASEKPVKEAITEEDRKGGTSRAEKKEYEQLPLEKIKLPEGFSINIYAQGVDNPRSLALSDRGTLFIGTRRHGSVQAVRDEDQDKVADKHYVLAEDWQMPNGVALKDGDLYVAEVSTIHKFSDVENNLENPTSSVIYDQYPTETHHGWKYIAFGPDGKLYVPVGAPCNLCLSEDEVFASITRINDDGSEMEVVQHGIRNTVGFTWHPDNGKLWFTDNGRDWMGDDIPGCEVNVAGQDGMHFGYPYCHQGDIPETDEEIPSKPCTEFEPPAQVLVAHTAPLGIEFIPAGNFPQKYHKQLLVAEHGSWNRTKKSGYKVMLLTLEGDRVTSYETFAEGWLERMIPYGEGQWIWNLCRMVLYCFLMIWPM